MKEASTDTPNAMQRIAMLTCLLLAVVFSVSSQTPKLPAMTDWFLSTGDWNGDPQIYIREFGTGTDTVIMLHGGWGGDHAGLVDAVRGDMAGKFHFIFYDQRGSLRSPFPDNAINYDAHIEDLERLRKELRLSKIKLVGHSMGGMLASAYAVKYPSRIKSLVLLAPANLKIPLTTDERALQQKQQALLEAFLNRPEGAQEMEKYKLNKPDAQLNSLELTAKFRINFAKRMLYDVSKWPMLTGGRALYKGNVFGLTERTYPKEWDFVTALSKQNFPVSIIMGDHDFIDFGNELIPALIKDKKNFTFTPIPKAGHLLWIDQPEMFAKTLAEKLK